MTGSFNPRLIEPTDVHRMSLNMRHAKLAMRRNQYPFTRRRAGCVIRLDRVVARIRKATLRSHHHGARQIGCERHDPAEDLNKEPRKAGKRRGNAARIVNSPWKSFRFVFVPFLISCLPGFLIHPSCLSATGPETMSVMRPHVPPSYPAAGGIVSLF